MSLATIPKRLCIEKQILDLPDELIDKIFPFLENPQDALAFSSTCRRVYDIFTGSQSLKNFIEQHFCCTLSFDRMEQFERLVALQTGQVRLIPLKVLDERTSPVKGWGCTPDNKYLITDSQDCTLKIWNLAKKNIEEVLKGHLSPISALYITPEGRAISGCEKGSLKYWNLTTQKCIKTLQLHPSKVSHISFVDPYLFSKSHQSLLSIYDCEKNQQITTWQLHEEVSSLYVLPDLQVLSLERNSDSLTLWDLKDHSIPPRFLEGHRKKVSSAAVSQDGTFALSGSYDKTLRLWNLQTAQSIHVFKGHTQEITCVILSSCEKLAFSASRDKTVKIWNLITREHLHTTKLPGVPLKILLTPDGQNLCINYDIPNLSDPSILEIRQIEKV